MTKTQPKNYDPNAQDCQDAQADQQFDNARAQSDDYMKQRAGVGSDMTNEESIAKGQTQLPDRNHWQFDWPINPLTEVNNKLDKLLGQAEIDNQPPVIDNKIVNQAEPPAAQISPLDNQRGLYDILSNVLQTGRVIGRAGDPVKEDEAIDIATERIIGVIKQEVDKARYNVYRSLKNQPPESIKQVIEDELTRENPNGR